MALDRLPSLVEAGATGFSLDKNSALASDGFSRAFSQHNWPIVGRDMLAAIGDFWASNPMAKSYMSSFIVLSPIKDNSITFSDFCSTSLCNLSVKLLPRFWLFV